MSNFLCLTKIQIKNVINSVFAKKKKKSILSLCLIVCGFVALMCLAMSSMYVEMARSLSEVNLTHYIFIQSGIVSIVFILFMVVIESSSGLFKSKDKELLASFPIKDSAIIASKFVSVLFSSYIYAFITFVPSIVIYFIFAGFDVATLFLLVFAYLIFPIFPTMIGLVLGAGVSWLTSKINSKFFSIFFSLLLTIAVILFSTFYQDIISFYIGKGASFASALCYVAPSVGLMLGGIFGGIWWQMLVLVAITIVSLPLGVMFCSFVYKKTNFLHGGKKKNKIVYYRQHSVMSALLKKECRTYFNSVVYVVNTIMFCIILLATPFIIYFTGLKDIMQREVLILVILLCEICLSSSCYISSVSISIEGKKFQNVKSVPVDVNKILYSKVLFAYIIIGTFAMLTSVIYVAMFNTLGAISLASIIILPQLCVFASCQLGVIINLLFPKMKFENDAQVVKQSLSSFLGMLGGVIINCLPLIIELFIYQKISNNYLILINFLYYILINLIFFIILTKKGKKLVNKIEP